jgi:DNA-binding MarR family transcriptional regulator
MPETEVPGWDTIGKLVEGLAYSSRPIHASVRDVTKKLGLGRRGPFILNLVSEGAEFPNELATKFRTSRSLITADLNRLIEAGLLTATPAETDKRRTRLQLTEAGRIVCGNIRREMARIVTRNLVAYSEDETRLFMEMLQAVGRLEPGEDYD